MLKNKKGLVMELILLVIVGIVIVAFFVMWKYGVNIINTQLLSIPAEDNASNVSYAAQETFSYMNTGLDQLKLISFMFFFGYIIATFIISYYSKDHPILLFVYFVITFILIIFGIYVANAYEEIQNDAVLGSYFKDFTASNFILLKLPYFIAVVGFFGVIISLSRILKDRGDSGI